MEESEKMVTTAAAEEVESKLNASIYYLVKRIGKQLNRTKIVKLLFIADNMAKKRLKRTISGTSYVYLLYGPYSDDIIKSIREMDGYEINEILDPYTKSYSYSKTDMPRIDPMKILDRNEVEILDEVIKNHGEDSLREILSYVYNLDCMKDAEPLDNVL